MAIDEPIQTRELEPLHVEPKDLQPIEFKIVSNHLTPGSIKRINVPIHYYHDVPIHDNNAVVSYEQNDMFSKAPIDIHILGVSNPKGCVHSQPHSHFQLKQFKELLQLSLCIFIFAYFFVLIKVMSEPL